MFFARWRSTLSSAGSAPLSRNASLDALRVLSLAGIVTLHASGGGFSDNKALAFVLDELSRFAVPVFFLLSAWFWKPEELERPLRLTWRVASRVLPAFAFWTGVMLVLAFRPLDVSPAGLLLLAWTGGPAFHLWFLPALVVATALVGAGLKYLGWRWTLGLSLALFLLGTVLGAYAKPLFGHGFPLWIDRNGLLFGPVFLTLGVLIRQHRERLAEVPMWGIVAAVIGFGILQITEGFLVVGRYPMGHDYSLATLGYAVAVLLLFARFDIRASIWSTLGKATFTAYLVHPLVLDVLVMDWKVRLTLLVIPLCLLMSLGIGCAWQAVRTRRAIRATPRGSTGSP